MKRKVTAAERYKAFTGSTPTLCLTASSIAARLTRVQRLTDTESPAIDVDQVARYALYRRIAPSKVRVNTRFPPGHEAARVHEAQKGLGLEWDDNPRGMFSRNEQLARMWDEGRHCAPVEVGTFRGLKVYPDQKHPPKVWNGG